MKIIQNFLLIFLFLFITNNLFAGLGNTTWGAGGIKRDIEVNEIEAEVVEEENKKESVTTESDDKFKSIELKNIDVNTVGTLTKDEGGLGYDMWSGSKRNIIEDYLGKKANVKLKPMQQGDVRDTIADITKLEKITDYKPQVDIEEGIKRFIDWYKGYHQTS